ISSWRQASMILRKCSRCVSFMYSSPLAGMYGAKPCRVVPGFGGGMSLSSRFTFGGTCTEDLTAFPALADAGCTDDVGRFGGNALATSFLLVLSFFGCLAGALAAVFFTAGLVAGADFFADALAAAGLLAAAFFTGALAAALLAGFLAVAGLAAGFFATTFFVVAFTAAFLAGALLAAAFFAGAFFAGAFFAGAFLAGAFFTAGFLAAAFLAGAALVAAFLAGALAADFFTAVFLGAAFFAGLLAALAAAGFFAATVLLAAFFAGAFFFFPVAILNNSLNICCSLSWFGAECPPAAGIKQQTIPPATGICHPWKTGAHYRKPMGIFQ